MNRFLNFLKDSRLAKLLLRFKWDLLFLLVLNFTFWYNSAPEVLFNDPTSTVLLDKEGNILNARIAADGQWRFPPRKTVPLKFKQAILLFEDKDFYDHNGVSIKAMARATKQNIAAGKIVSGGSTITMQVIRLSRKGKSRTFFEKFNEIYQATRIEWTYTKDQILTMYASNAPMGGNVVGIDAAAWRYYGRKPENLSWAESCLLAVLPNAPSLLHLSKNREKLLAKRNRLLLKLKEKKILSKTEYQLAIYEPLPLAPPDLPNAAPHLTNLAIASGSKGKIIESNIDPFYQREVTKIISYHHTLLEQNEIHNACVVVLDLEKHTTIAYVGNTQETYGTNQNAVNIVDAPRSTGSILKPFLYASLLEDGIITPAQLIEDVPMILSGYAPKNYDQKYDGLVPANKALSRSLNVPIVKLLKEYGIQKFHQKLKDLGLTTINRPSSDYGLSLILGGAEVKLWDLVQVYANMAGTLNDYAKGKTNQTLTHDPYNVAKSNSSVSILNPGAIWHTFQAMLAVSRPDNLGGWEQFNTSQKIAWKTGTSYGFRDAWAIGVTPKYAVGVWVGNADGEGRPGLIGVKTAAPIMFDVFKLLPKSAWFSAPYDDMVEMEICSKSGCVATDICPETEQQFLPKNCIHATNCKYHKRIFTSEDENFRVLKDCYTGEVKSKSWFVVKPKCAMFYKTKDPSYRPLPPWLESCKPMENELPLDIIYPKSASNILTPVDLDGTVNSIVLEATHLDFEAEIHWHLDDKYLGMTKDLHQMEVYPNPGKHKLSITDDEGNKTTVNFTVIAKEN